MGLHDSIKQWLGFDRPIGLEVTDKGLALSFPNPRAIKRGERLAAIAKSPWTLSLISGLFIALVTKLLDLL